MIKVSVYKTEFREQSGIGKVTGRPYDMALQEVWMHLVGKDGVSDPHPQKTEIILEKSSDGAVLFYAVGDYQLHPSSVYLDHKNKPDLSVRLVPLKQTPRAA